MTNPNLADDERARLVQRLMRARQALRRTKGSKEAERAEARAEVQRVKVVLGERGAVWWEDGAPDYNRHLAKNSPYAEWFARVGV